MKLVIIVTRKIIGKVTMKTIIFDMDGLMFDTNSVFENAWDYAGEKIGIGKAGYMATKTLGMGIRVSRHLWIEEFGDRYNEDAFRKYAKEYIKFYYKENIVPVKKGLFELLEYLQSEGFKIAVATSSPFYEVEKHLNDAGIFNSFQVIVSGDMVEKSKPEPDIYLKVCNLLGVKPSDCFALEDSKTGLFSAYKAGCKAIMIPDVWQADEETEKIIYKKFNDLIEVREFLKEKLLRRE